MAETFDNTEDWLKHLASFLDDDHTGFEDAFGRFCEWIDEDRWYYRDDEAKSRAAERKDDELETMIQAISPDYWLNVRPGLLVQIAKGSKNASKNLERLKYLVEIFKKNRTKYRDKESLIKEIELDTLASVISTDSPSEIRQFVLDEVQLVENTLLSVQDSRALCALQNLYEKLGEKDKARDVDVLFKTTLMIRNESLASREAILDITPKIVTPVLSELVKNSNNLAKKYAELESKHKELGDYP